MKIRKIEGNDKKFITYEDEGCNIRTEEMVIKNVKI